MTTDLLTALELEAKIKDWSEPEKFLARTLMDVKKTCEIRRTCPEFQFSKKQLTVGTGWVGFISIIVAVIIEMVSRKFGW